MREDDPQKGQPATIVGLFHKHPGTIILVQERRMLVQEDTVIKWDTDGYGDAEMGVEYGKSFPVRATRNPQGIIRGFTRRKNSKKWHSADPGKNLSVIVGRRVYEQSQPGAAHALL